MKNDPYVNSRQYCLYLGGIWAVLGGLVCAVQISDGHLPTRAADLLGLFFLVKGLPLFVCGLKFNKWIETRPARIRAVARFNLTLSVLAFGTSMWSSNNGTVFTGDLFLAGLGQQLLEGAVSESEKPKGTV